MSAVLRRLDKWSAWAGMLAGAILGTYGALARERAPVLEFRAAHPCPSTTKIEGPCPGWVVDHKYPLCAGGADTPENMQWEQLEESYTKDRLERELCALRAKLEKCAP